jgi:hypothetical protein
MNREELDADIQAVAAYQGRQLISGFFVVIISFALLLPTTAGLSLCLLIDGFQIIEKGTQRNVFMAISCLINAVNFYVLWRLGSTKRKKILTLRKEYVRNIFFLMTFLSYGMGHIALN